MSPDEEKFVVSETEIEGAHGFPIDTYLIAAALQSIVEPVKARPACNEISPKSAAKYFRTAVNQVKSSNNHMISKVIREE